MNIFKRVWHSIAHQKDALIRAIETVANNLDQKHSETIAHFHNAFKPSSQVEADHTRQKLITDLKQSVTTIKKETHAKPNYFESHDQLASLAQSTLNEHLTHSGIGDDVDAFFNKYGSADLAGWVPVFLKILAEKFHVQSKYPFIFEDSADETRLFIR